MRPGMLSRVLTTKEQIILIGVCSALCVGCVAIVVSRSLAPPEDPALEDVVPPDEVVAIPASPVQPAPPEPPPVEATLDPPPDSKRTAPVSVAIVGAVTTPGVYTLEAGARVKELIEAADGLLEDADASDINMAAPLFDGSTLTIPTGAHAAVEGDRLVVRGAPRQAVANPRQYTISGWGYEHADYGPPGLEGAVAGRSGSSGASTEGGRIDINRASLEELDTLPGIGPVKAQDIVNYRQQQPFRSVDELEEVNGIGPKTLENLRPHVTVGAS